MKLITCNFNCKKQVHSQRLLNKNQGFYYHPLNLNENIDWMA